MSVLKIGKEKLYFILDHREILCFYNFCPVWKNVSARNVRRNLPSIFDIHGTRRGKIHTLMA
jgi:hypothetical protein